MKQNETKEVEIVPFTTSATLGEKHLSIKIQIQIQIQKLYWHDHNDVQYCQSIWV